MPPGRGDRRPDVDRMRFHTDFRLVRHDDGAHPVRRTLGELAAGSG